MAFVPAESSKNSPQPDLFVVIYRGKLLCETGQTWALASPEVVAGLPAKPSQSHYLGTMDGQHCFAVFFRDPVIENVEGFEWKDLRSQLGYISEEYFQLAGRAVQITRWFRDHRYCGTCGHETREASSDRALVCTRCDTRFYPRISPCVIGLVLRDNQCLLGRGVRHPEGMYSTLAGFVEPGESAEQAFAREVKEEVGIEVDNIRYITSQAWPFPGQLMIGFFADYVSGDITPNPSEIIDAAWFSIDRLPKIPPDATIAGSLIQHFIKQQGEA